MADLDRQGASYTRGIWLDVGGRATTAPAGDESAGPLADGHNQEVTHREGLGNFTYLINAGDTAANDTAPGDRTATAVQDVAPARECNCPDVVVRCAHFGGQDVLLAVRRRKNGILGGWRVTQAHSATPWKNLNGLIQKLVHTPWLNTDALDAANAAFDFAVDRLRSEALP